MGNRLMATFLGYALYSNLTAFYNWQGTDSNPAANTINKLLGFSRGARSATRYTRPIAHPDSDYVLDAEGIPYVPPVGFWEALGKLFTNPDRRVICMIKDDCPQAKMPGTIYTKAEVQAFGFIPERILGAR
jgi:hypothetical protein